MIGLRCSNPKEAEIDSLKKSCIEIHDEVMPKISEIAKIRMALKPMILAIESDTADSVVAIRKSYVEGTILLDSAHEAMMNWMAEYIPDYEMSYEADSALAYYKNERDKITEVKVILM